ncbi:MAG: CoA pyrophosphatase, partial [Actinomycetota bacterium]|nr:CoA pyrophosphatase [Actinomycetota bacterium]
TMVLAGRWSIIRPVHEPNKDGHEAGGGFASEDFAARLREVMARPLNGWRELYESFSPVDLTTGERHPRVPEPGEDHRQAAVLVPVLLEPEGACLVYTVRKDHLQDHGGQISFPGGIPELEDDSLRVTALREAEEEINLRPEVVEVIGELEDMYIPPSGFLVRPFVGLLPQEAELDLDPEEVEAIFSVSLEELASPESFKRVVWERDGRPHEVPVFAVAGYEIWGATAAMTAALLARLGWEAGNAIRTGD